MELKPTPSEAFRFVRTDGQPLPDRWKCGGYRQKDIKLKKVSAPDDRQTLGICGFAGCRIHLRGVSAKDIDAVAMGRHGNFFFWGFSASQGEYDG